MAAASRLAWTHNVRGCVCAWIRVQDQQTDLVLQLVQHLGWEISGGNEPLPLFLLLQELQNAAFNELLLQQLLFNLQTTTASKPIS